MKIKFEKVFAKSWAIMVDGAEVGLVVDGGGWNGTTIEIGGKFVARFKKLGGSVGAAKRWVKHNIEAQGGAEQLREAVEAHRANEDRKAPSTFGKVFPEPLPRRTEKTRRNERRLADWARGFTGHRCHFIHGERFVCETSTHGVLTDIASEGFMITLDDGTETVIRHEAMQAVWPPPDAKRSEPVFRAIRIPVS